MNFLSVATPLLERTATGFLIASGIAFIARRAGSLSSIGALAAVAVGTASVVAGWRWGLLLVVYFVASTLLSHCGSATKQRLIHGMVAKGGARDAVQVIANGGVFASCALLASVGPSGVHAVLTLAALGALAASTADTWATEIGTLFGGPPWSILTLMPLEPGASGGVSVIGSVAMVTGATVIALVATALGLTGEISIVAAAGVAGAVADSFLGATMQERRWCPVCARSSERRVHDCGAPTALAGGREWMDNDLVNLIGGVIGAAVAAMLALL